MRQNHHTKGEDDRKWPIATFSSAAEFGRYRGIADMAELVAGSTQSRMTQTNTSGSGLLPCKLTPETHFIGGKSLL